MKMMFKAMILAGSAVASAGGSLAQQVDLPPFLQAMGGLTYQGQVSGMDLYSMEGFDGLWLISPDGRMAVAGTVFSGEGRDIGATILGREPVRAFELDLSDAPDQNQGYTPIDPDSLPLAEAGGSPLLTGRELTEMEANVSRIEAQVFGQEPAPDDAPAGRSEEPGDEAPSGSIEEPGDEAPSGSIDAAEVTRDAEEALSGMSAEDKEILTRALVEMLRDVKSEEQFKSVVEVWTEEVVRRYREDHAGGGAEETSDANDANGNADTGATEPRTAAEPSDDALRPVTLEERETTIADDLLGEVRHDSLWFGIGKHDAPVVYAFIDPACPYCAKAIVNIGDEISDGRLQLRVALVPAISARSPDLIASIFMDDEPPIAFMEHEYDWVNGRSPLKPAKWDDIPGQVRDGLLHNIQIMKDYEISGVPFFVFDTEDGARVLSGVPDPEDFAAAIEDPYMGKF